jgi:hypothetical protein
MSILIKPISALEKCFMDESIDSKRAVCRGEALLGEEFSFEVAYTSDDPADHPKRTAHLAVVSPLRESITVRTVEQVPVRMPCYAWADDNYLRKTPGLYPDLLVPLDPKDDVWVTFGELKALWVTVRVPEGCTPGDYPISVRLECGEQTASAEFTLHVIGAALPKQKMIVTEWFHADCIANYYGLDTFSCRHWEYIAKFMRTAVQNGINAILMPVFTPPLDTAVGGERRTTQLVDVTKTADGWEFGFDRVEHWVEIAKCAGVEYYEISHFYTQWGAGHAPKVMAWVDGEYRRVFGWETDAASPEYRDFLRAFIPEFLAKMKELGVADRCLFHVSDEPHLDHLASYKAAREQIADLLEGYRIMDALSSFELYQTGACTHPIPSNNHIEPFLEAGVEDLWTYYCCGQGNEVSNRFLAMPMARTRVIGTQFWKYQIAGFLQWGYNFYSSQYSVRPIDPYQVTDGEYFFPAGDGFAVYPGPMGEPYETLHMKAFTMALIDRRAMDLAEEMCGREAVLAVLESEGEVTFSKYPHSAEWLEGVRAGVNRLIEEKTAGK